MVFIINLSTRNTCRPNLFLKSRYFCIHWFCHSIWAEEQKHSAIVSNPNWENYENSLHTNNWKLIYYSTLRFSFPQLWCRIWREVHHRNCSGRQFYSVAPKIFCSAGQLQFWQFWMPQDRCLLKFQVLSETWQCFTSSTTQKWTLKSCCYEIPHTTGAESHK